MPTSAERAYNKGTSTQVPIGRVLGVVGRVSRRINFNGMTLYYEQVQIHKTGEYNG